MMKAYEINRTLLMEETNCIMDMVKPITSKLCSISHFSNSDPKLVTIDLRRQDNLTPVAIPAHLQNKIRHIHDNPFLWWTSQVVKYVFRLRPSVLKRVQKISDEHHPIAGVHVRRTDKLKSEAKFHDIEEYMAHVEEYFSHQKIESGTNLYQERHIFLASDDNHVLQDARKRYPEYTIWGYHIQQRQSHRRVACRQELKQLVDTLHQLSQTDYLVCTFSSNMCRLAFEMMTALRLDAPQRFKSLDSLWYFDRQRPIF